MSTTELDRILTHLQNTVLYLVDYPEAIEIEILATSPTGLIMRVNIHDAAAAKLIRPNRATAQALQTLCFAAGGNLRLRLKLEIVQRA